MAQISSEVSPVGREHSLCPELGTAVWRSRLGPQHWAVLGGRRPSPGGRPCLCGSRRPGLAVQASYSTSVPQA